MEKEIYKILTDAYGKVFEPAAKDVIEVRKNDANEGLDIAVLYFKNNPSAEHFNLLKVAMLTYQYWVQKRVIE